MSTAIRKAATRERSRAVAAWLRLARAFQKINARSERLFREQNLNTAQFDVLTNIGATQGRSQQELADALLVTKGNVSQLLGKLEQRGLITRRHEGRTNCLSLTPKGSRTYEVVVPMQEALIGRLFSPLTADEQQELLRLLRKLDHALVE